MNSHSDNMKPWSKTILEEFALRQVSRDCKFGLVHGINDDDHVRIKARKSSLSCGPAKTSRGIIHFSVLALRNQMITIALGPLLSDFEGGGVLDQCFVPAFNK